MSCTLFMCLSANLKWFYFLLESGSCLIFRSFLPDFQKCWAPTKGVSGLCKSSRSLWDQGRWWCSGSSMLPLIGAHWMEQISQLADRGGSQLRNTLCKGMYYLLWRTFKELNSKPKSLRVLLQLTTHLCSSKGCLIFWLIMTACKHVSKTSTRLATCSSSWVLLWWCGWAEGWILK